RAGERESRNKLVERNSVLVLERGNEVCRIETKFVVADPGSKRYDAAARLSEFHRVSRGGNFDCADRVRTEPHRQRSAHRRRNVESVEQVLCLPGLSAGDVDLAGSVLNNSRIKRQQIADIARGWIRNVDDLGGLHAARVGGL